MIVASGIIVGFVFLVELVRRPLELTNLSEGIKSLIVAILHATVTVIAYRKIFAAYEKRPISELSLADFTGHAVTGFATGILMQAFFILVICLAGTYSVLQTNLITYLAQPFAFALTAGFVAEIIIIGVVFRLLERQTGTMIALVIFIILFAALHIKSQGATVISVCATAMQAGFMLPAAFVFSRSLWLPIFLHFGWDLAEPGIFGAINPSNSLTQGLLTSKIEGSPIITGGVRGPQDSLESMLLSLALGLVFLLFAMKKGRILRPKWEE
ncbi:MAG TPA: CPBP family intramembrane glutamic endopeptidase [Puia sp.]|nr:CPBP family intramembrane glutamic endopeptidase [Puia sp.]